METQKQVVHFQAKKGFTTAQSNEHQRRWTEKGWERANEDGRIDRTRTRLNFEIVRGGKVRPVDQSKSIPEIFRENLRSRGIADPNASCPENPRIRTVVDFIISGSHERLCQLAFGRQKVDLSPGADNRGVNRRQEIERWAKDMYDVLTGRFGEDNILSFVVHLDERTPHIHADIVPCGADKYEYRRRTLALHDLFGAVNRRWGLERGDSVSVTHAKKISHEEYRRELSGECSTLEKEVDRKNATLKSLEGQIAQAAKRMKGLTTMVSNLEAARGRIEEEIDAIRQSLSDEGLGTDRRSDLRAQEESLQKKLDEILAKLDDKRGKLKDAERKLSELRRQIEASEERQEELDKQIRSATSQVSEIALNKVGIQALWTVLRFAENKGGGGGHSHGGWGRDKDEDDRAWIMRCLARSRQMMAPAGRRIKR